MSDVNTVLQITVFLMELFPAIWLMFFPFERAAFRIPWPLVYAGFTVLGCVTAFYYAWSDNAGDRDSGIGFVALVVFILFLFLVRAKFTQKAMGWFIFNFYGDLQTIFIWIAHILRSVLRSEAISLDTVFDDKLYPVDSYLAFSYIVFNLIFFPIAALFVKKIINGYILIP